MAPALAGVLAVLTGAFVAIQAAALAPLTRVVHPAVAALWSQLLGVGTAAGLVLVTRQVVAWPASAWPWALVAGSCTVAIVTLVGTVVTPLGLAVAIGTITAAQLLTALAFDALGATGQVIPLTPLRVGGALLIVVGAVLLFLRPAGA